MGRPDLKVEALERIDELILGPMMQELPALGDFALLLMPDHSTPSKLKTHSNEAVPFAIVTRDGLANDGGVPRRYTEANAAKTAVVVREGYRLIDSLFAKEAHSANN